MAAITESSLDLIEPISFVSSPKYGAVVCFSGHVRLIEEGREIESINYEAYQKMAEKMIIKIIEDAEKRWGVKVFVQHRVGKINVGEASVLVACGGKHRKETFEACQFVINEVKEKVPIWKVGYEWA